MSADRPSPGRSATTLPPQRRRTTLRPSWGRSLRSSVSRRSRSAENSLRLAPPQRLAARAKQYGLTSRSMALEGPVLSAACLRLRGQLTCLLSCPRWATRDGKLPEQTLRSMVPPSSSEVQSKWSEKRGAFGISRMMTRRISGDNLISCPKLPP
jgi:hypothetical protein